jgi:hypothetical protein
MRRLFACASCLFALACGHGSEGARGDNGDDAAPMLPPLVPLPECPDENYDSCDILKADCRDRIAALAACVRESKPAADLRFDVMTEDEYAAVIHQDIADDPPPPVPHFEQALSLLGLGPPEGVDIDEGIQNHVERLGGVYRTAEKRIVIIDHGYPSDTAYIDAVLLHELIHSEQDADYDLLNWPSAEGTPYTFDQRMASNSVVEGEASFYEHRAVVPLLGIDVTPATFHQALSEQLDEMLGEAAGSPSAYNTSYVTFPYGYGAPQAYEAWLHGGPRNIDTLWASPPTNSQAVISALYGVDTPQSSGVELPAPDVPSLTPFTDDVLGAWGILLFLHKQDAAWGDVVRTALAWRGDHLWVFTDESDAPTYVLWEIELANEAAAKLVNDSLEHASATTYPFDHQAMGTRVFMSAAFQDLALSELTTAGNAWLSSD